MSANRIIKLIANENQKKTRIVKNSISTKNGGNENTRSDLAHVRHFVQKLIKLIYKNPLNPTNHWPQFLSLCTKINQINLQKSIGSNKTLAAVR